MKQPKSLRSVPVLTYLVIIGAGLLRAVTTHTFIIPNHFVDGGFAGASVMLQYVTRVSAGAYLLAFNIPLAVLAYFFIGKKFAVRTLVAAGSASVFLMLLGILETALNEKFGISLYYAAENRMLPAAAGGLLNGLALALVLKCGASNGGTDVLATMIQRRNTHVNVAWFIFALDSVSVVISVFVYPNETGALINYEPLILAGVLMFVASKTCETVLEGFKAALKFEIVTSDPEPLSKEIMETLGRGVTLLPAKGMYTLEDKAVLICVIRRRQITQLEKIVKRYPDTFCFISSARDVKGKF